MHELQYYLYIDLKTVSGKAGNIRDKLHIKGNILYKSNPQGSTFLMEYNALWNTEGLYSSAAQLNETGITAQPDVWNFLPHFYYHDADVFIVSSNVFIISALLDSTISENAVLDSLIFGRPYLAGTWFNDIKKLEPRQKLVYNSREKTLKLNNSEVKHWRDYASGYSQTDVAQQFYDDFHGIAEKLQNTKNGLQFSGGSDSVTIFSGLKHFSIPFECYSYKTTATKKHVIPYVKKFCTKFKVSSHAINCILDDYSDSIISSLLLSNGLAPTAEFTYFYNQIPKNLNLFDGYSFTAGTYSDAFLHPVFMQLLCGEKKVDYSEFTRQYNNRLTHYYMDNYWTKFGNVNDNDGMTKLHEYVFDYIPQSIIGPVLVTALHLGHHIHSYFMTHQYIFIHFNLNIGIAKTMRLRSDFRKNKAGTKKLLGVICSSLDRQIYRTKLDSMLSMKDYNSLPRFDIEFILVLKKRMKSLVQKMNYSKATAFQPVLHKFLHISNQQSDTTINRRLANLDIVLNNFDLIKCRVFNSIKITELK